MDVGSVRKIPDIITDRDPGDESDFVSPWEDRYLVRLYGTFTRVDGVTVAATPTEIAWDWKLRGY